jgi:acyl-CoA dehydrogenase
VTAFGLTAAQQEFAAQVRTQAPGELRPRAEAGQPGRVNRELLRAMGRLGLLARLFPGVGLPGAAAGQLSREAPAIDLCLLRESLATECTEAETALALPPVLQRADQVPGVVVAILGRRGARPPAAARCS